MSKNRTPLPLHQVSGLFVNTLSKVWKTTVVEQKAIVAMKVANVNNTGGNLVSDCLSQGAQGVSMPKPRVNIPAPAVANPPIKSNVPIDAFCAVRWAVIITTRLTS